jgi:hypothetical protein
VYGIPPEQVVGSAEGTKYGYQKDGTPFLTKEPKLLLNDDNAGKPEGIHLTGDREMLEYTGAGAGAPGHAISSLIITRKKPVGLRWRATCGASRWCSVSAFGER